MARASRVPQSQPLYDDSDSNAGTEQDTPKRKPRRSELRKRLSEAYHPDHDSLMSESGGQAGQKSVEINDDAAEKRRRRKSTRMAAPQPAPTSEAVDGQDQGDSSRTVKQKLQLPAIPPPVFNKEDMAVTYERWMKIATDNKISAQNTWELMLIDYFHDMSLLRNEDDNSINFQRASCTLDGCIKIWTSRVDSVGTETAKLASNLASGGVGDDDGVDDDGSDDPDGDRVERKKKKSHRTVATLVRDPAQLKAKKLDLEFSVDPLFRKTCADFDEGGAQGLLMNHLSLGVGQDGNLRVVFDASDSMIRPEGEEEEEEREDLIDLTYLRDTFMPNLSDLESKAICHSLDEFSFTSNNLSQDETTFFQDNTPHDDDDDDDDFGANFDVSGTDNAQDFFTGNDAVNDDFVGDMGGDDFGGDDSNGNMDIPPGEGTGPYVPFDPRHAPKANDLVLAMTGDADGEGGMMDYFDKTFLKNWAGPEHWKMRRAVRPADADATATKEPKRREKKEAFRIDFLEPRTEEASKALAEKLFAKPGKGASINLPGTTANGARTRKKTKEKEKKSDHKLPDDMHFSSHQLISLFLKPKFTLQSRGSGNNTGSRAQHNDELDVDFWAQTADQAAQRNNDGDETAGPIPFNTQFFHDDYDDGPGFDDVDDGFGGAIDPGEQDLLGPSQGMPRRAKPEAVKYSKRAKRVDVRKLKDNIWKGLDIVVPKNKEEEENEMDVDEDVEPTEPSESRQFDSVISNLQTVYPSDKMAEISTSFCFICLLHLANEQGLKLENPTTPNDRSAHDERKVGNIWDLKVYRDPEASAV
ncbi:barren [Marasmius fiardii PR-910]|nr:barren [Marasmius fiardii PR-910]